MNDEHDADYDKKRRDAYFAHLSHVMSMIEQANTVEELQQAWDQFWLMEDEEDSFDCGSMHSRYLVPHLFDRNVKTILCVGNGASWEAPALAHAGFQVEVLDPSLEAKRRLERLVITPLREKKALGGDYARPGGSLVIHTGDFRVPSTCAGPFDVVIARRLLQYYPMEALADSLQALHARLIPNGLLVVESQNARKERSPYFEILRARGFLVCGDFWVKDRVISAPKVLSLIRPKPMAWVISSTG